jgi:hypothetical protein
MLSMSFPPKMKFLDETLTVVLCAQLATRAKGAWGLHIIIILGASYLLN